MTDTAAAVTASTDGTSSEPAGGNGGDTSTATTANDFKPPATQDELNRIIAERVRREAAKYGDYSDLKAKAVQFDAITEAQKTELQRIQERAEAAERRAEALESRQQVADWKADIVNDPAYAGVKASVLRGNTQEELLAHAAEIKALLPVPDPRKGAYVPGEGRGGAATTDPATQFAQILRNARER